jgi:hypothetical protein
MVSQSGGGGTGSLVRAKKLAELGVSWNQPAQAATPEPQPVQAAVPAPQSAQPEPAAVATESPLFEMPFELYD